MPKRLNKREFDDAVYHIWFSRLCTYGMRPAKKMIFEAYKELRRQEKERKKNGKTKS